MEPRTRAVRWEQVSRLRDYGIPIAVLIVFVYLSFASPSFLNTAEPAQRPRPVLDRRHGRGRGDPGAHRRRPRPLGGRDLRDLRGVRGADGRRGRDPDRDPAGGPGRRRPRADQRGDQHGRSRQRDHHHAGDRDHDPGLRPRADRRVTGPDGGSELLRARARRDLRRQVRRPGLPAGHRRGLVPAQQDLVRPLHLRGRRQLGRRPPVRGAGQPDPDGDVRHQRAHREHRRRPRRLPGRDRPGRCRPRPRDQRHRRDRDRRDQHQRRRGRGLAHRVRRPAGDPRRQRVQPAQPQPDLAAGLHGRGDPRGGGHRLVDQEERRGHSDDRGVAPPGPPGSCTSSGSRRSVRTTRRSSSARSPTTGTTPTSAARTGASRSTSPTSRRCARTSR